MAKQIAPGRARKGGEAGPGAPFASPHARDVRDVPIRRRPLYRSRLLQLGDDWDSLSDNKKDTPAENTERGQVSALEASGHRCSCRSRRRGAEQARGDGTCLPACTRPVCARAPAGLAVHVPPRLASSRAAGKPCLTATRRSGVSAALCHVSAACLAARPPLRAACACRTCRLASRRGL